MAKKNSDTLFKDYLAELSEINPALKDILSDEKVSAKLKEGVLARADYSAKMDEFRTSMESERTAFAQEVTEARTKIAGWQKWYGDTTQQVAGIQERLKQYEDTYGDIDPGERRQVAKALGVTKEELNTALESRMNERDLAALKFADDLTDVKLDYDRRFKEPLDTQAVFKIAGERQTDLKTAYNLMIAPRVEEIRTKDLDERIKRERKEAVEEFASQHKLPTVDTRSDLTHTLDIKDAPKTQHDRVAAAIAGLRRP